MCEQAAHKTIGEFMPVALNVKLQCAATHVLHHHVNRFIGAEEILHAHDVGVGNRRQRTAFLKKTLESMTKNGEILFGIYFHFRTADPNHQRGRQVFLDRHGQPVVIAPKIHNRKPAR